MIKSSQLACAPTKSDHCTTRRPSFKEAACQTGQSRGCGRRRRGRTSASAVAARGSTRCSWPLRPSAERMEPSNFQLTAAMPCWSRAAPQGTARVRATAPATKKQHRCPAKLQRNPRLPVSKSSKWSDERPPTAAMPEADRCQSAQKAPSMPVTPRPSANMAHLRISQQHQTLMKKDPQ